jgi:S-adenosylmethionine-dependent methyltransferase
VAAVPPAIFDQQMDQWQREQALPWYQLKHHQVQVNLAQHLPSPPLRILDAGGGNGLDSLPLAALGHTVVIADYSTAMLADAEARAVAAGVSAQVRLHQADLSALGAALADEVFDVVLCHNVMQYLPDPSGVLRVLARLVRVGGLLSLVSMNRYSSVYAAAFLRDDLTAAQEQIDARTTRGVMFPADLIVYSPEEAAEMLAASGLTVAAHYGLLCITPYWGDNAAKHDPAIYAQLAALEAALADKHPYKLLARHFHLIAQKR